MHDQGNLELVLIFLMSAVISVPLFRRFGLGAVLAYLVAGVVIGPFGLKVVKDPSSTLALSELGVVLLLFIIGLELSPARLWVMRRPVFLIGGLQVLLSGFAIGVALMFFGWSWKTNLIIGLGLALSSTAVVLQLLAERKELTTGYGRLAFAILLFQDIAAIPLLALIPLLGEAKAAAQSVPPLDGIVKALGIIFAVIIVGRLLLKQLFRIVAWTQSSEVFTATALLVVVGTAYLMQLGGLSMALGAFLAGVLLADSEFRHELESQIEPFKGLLLGLFFIAVGMSINLKIVLAEPALIIGAVLALLIVKSTILMFLGGCRLGKLHKREVVMLGAMMALGGEFAFVVFSEAFKYGLLEPAIRDRLIAVVGLSMAISPLAVLALSSWWKQNPEEKQEIVADEIDHDNPRVIIAGFGRMGQIVGRILRAQNIPFTALEHSAEQVSLSRRFGSTIYFGDPSKPDLLKAARADRAEIFVLTTDDPEATVRTARLLKRLYPHLKVFARARNRQHAFKLMDLGVEVIRETFHSSLELSEQVMLALGVPAEVAADRRERFRQHDEAMLQEQHLVYDDEAALIASSQQAFRDLENLFAADANPGGEGKSQAEHIP
ncbi:MAG: monovalent cation:proton antiporter-2 (CPA2) family protein [Arenimonas sp.]